MIVKASKGLFGSLSKGRLSLWQFQKVLGAHSRSNYYDMNQAGQRQMSTKVQWEKLGGTALVIEEFKWAGDNFELWLRETANSAMADDLHQMVKAVMTYYLSMPPSRRIQECTVTLCFDLIDVMHDLNTDFVTSLSHFQRTDRSLALTYELMQKQYEDIDFTAQEMLYPLKLEVREYCSKHFR